MKYHIEGERMAKLGITISRLAHWTGIGPATISRYRHGTRSTDHKCSHVPQMCELALRVAEKYGEPGKELLDKHGFYGLVEKVLRVEGSDYSI